jgi:competence protein ComFC
VQQERSYLQQINNNDYGPLMMLLEKLINIVAPHSCLGCGAEGQLICDWCHTDVCPTLPERCFGCHKLSIDSKVCDACRRKSPLKHVWVRTEYDGIAKGLVHKLKFERSSAAALPIAQLMAEDMPYLPPETIITHIPTATRRYRQRGYDQAELIARRIARIKQVHYVPLLRRHGQSRQVGAKRTQRLIQLEGAFRPRNNHSIADKHIIVVDDIVTTGATLKIVAKILRANGAKRVDAAVFAQKQ